MWMAVIEKETFDSIPLELPLNLPANIGLNGQKTFENFLLLDRPSDVRAGDHRYFKNTAGKQLDAAEKNSNIEEDGAFDIHSIDDDGRKISAPYAVRDEFRMVRETELWWENGDSTVVAGRASSKFSFLTLPYIPFFSNCDGYDSNMSISRLLEDHPNCTLVDFGDTRPVNQYSWFDSLPPLSDTCRNDAAVSGGIGGRDQQRGIDLSCVYEEEVDAPNDNFWLFEVSPGETLFYISKYPTPPAHFEANYQRDAHTQSLTAVSRWGRSPHRSIKFEILTSSFLSL